MSRKQMLAQTEIRISSASSLSRSATMATSKFWVASGAMGLAIVIGIAGGVFGAFLSTTAASPAQSTLTSARGAVQLRPGTQILLLDKGTARAVAKVDRNGVILLSFTSPTGQNRVALGMLGNSKLAVGVFDSGGKPKAGMEVPMKDSGRVHMLLNRKPAPPAASHGDHLAS
jgi:hypothetical protein